MPVRACLASLALACLLPSLTLAQGGHRHDPGFCAVAPDPTPFALAQPDGSTFTAVQRGTGAVVYLETVDGYTVLPDPHDGTYRLALEGPDGRLLLTDVAAADPGERSDEDARLTGSLKPHARLSGAPLHTVVADYARQTSSAAAPADHDPYGDPPHEHDVDGPDAAVHRRTGGFPALGTHRALMLLIDFPDAPAAYTVADIERMCNEEGYDRNGQTGSFRDYYRDVSYGQLTVDTEVQPWATAEHPRAHYGIQDYDDRDYSKAPVLVREAVDAAEARGLDFSQFDGDGDGDVDMVLVIHAGRGAEESRDPDDIWSHRWGLGQHHVKYDGVRVYDYIIQPEIYRGQGQLANIGVLVHEFGHALGLPDLYDIDYSTQGISTWGVMAGGTWANSGRTPTQPSAWSKAALGWTTPAELAPADAGTVTGLLPTGRAAGAYQLLTPEPDEYFLVEARERTGWDRFLPAAGVLVYHVDEGQPNNSDEAHRLVDVEQADGEGDLYTEGGGADGTDVFGTDDARRGFACDAGLHPDVNSALYGGGDSGARLSDIVYAPGGSSFAYGGCDACAIVDIRLADTLLQCASGTFVQGFEVGHSAQAEARDLILAIDAGGGVYRDTAHVPAGATATALSVAGLPLGAGAADALAYFREEPTCRLAVAAVTGGIVACVRNDDMCDAADVTAALLAGRPISGTTAGFSAEADEPAPKRTDWVSQRGWGETTLARTAWYRFTAPASGHVDIHFDETAVQAALWEAEDCTALRDGTRRLGVAASDDASSADYGPHLRDVRCLLPGRTYYLQVDSEFDGEHDFTFLATVGADQCRSASAPSDCAPTATQYSSGTGTWIQHRPQRGDQVIAAVNDRGATAGSVDILRTSLPDAGRLDGEGRALAHVSWRLDLETETPLTARLYLSFEEWDAIRTELGVSELAELGLRRYNDTACGSFASEVASLSPSAVQAAYNGEDNVLQFELPGSGNYGFVNAAPLPVTFRDVAAYAKTRHNLVTWRTADERDLRRYALEARAEGASTWREIATAAPDPNGAYALLDEAPATGTYYRIRNDDRDGGRGYSAVVFVARADLHAAASAPLRLMPNPASDYVTVTAAGTETLDVRDLRGAVLRHVTTDASAARHDVDLSGLPPGTYLVTAAGPSGVRVARLVVR